MKKCVLTKSIMVINGWKVLNPRRRRSIFNIKALSSLFITIVLVALIGHTAQGIVYSTPMSVSYKAFRHLPHNAYRTDLYVEESIRAIALEKNFKWTDWLVRLAMCESTLNPDATLDNGHYGLDRGLFQINNKYHPEVSDECAFDIKCATEWTMWRVKNGHQNEWVCNTKI